MADYSTSLGNQFKEITKTFVINHPTKRNKYLVHACLEGPESGVYYRGSAKIKENDSVKVFLPDYTSKWFDYTVNVTPIGKPARVCSASKIVKGVFEIYGSPGLYNWTIFAKRSGIIVERDKETTVVHGDGPYRWIG
jgi:hypothetical protein